MLVPTRAISARTRPFASLLVLLLGLVVASCESTPSYPGLTHPVDADGTYAVGFRTFDLTYTPPGGTATRTIPVVMWYPADPAKTAAMPSQVFPTYFLYTSQVAVQDAPPAEAAFPGGFPVIVHSHGHFGLERQSYWLGEGMAALGFVVIAPGHIGDRLPDVNTMVPSVDDYYLRVTDIRATLDLLENLPAGDPHQGRCNTARVIMTGHSRGTNTVWAAMGAPFDVAYVQGECNSGTYDASGGCPAEKVAVYGTDLHDPRVVGGIPMAGSGDYSRFGGFTPMNAVTIPVMELSGGDDQVGADQIFANVTTPPMTWAEILHGCHELFGFGWCDATLIDVPAAQAVLRIYVHAFARRVLFDDADPRVVGILDGSIPVSSIVTYHTR